MSNRIFQTVVNQMNDAIDSVFGVIDENCNIIACSVLSRIGETLRVPVEDVFAGIDIFQSGTYTFNAFGNPVHPEFAVFVEGTDGDAGRVAKLLALSMDSIKQFYDEKFDKTNFIKNVMTDNCLPGEIFERSHELHMDEDALRVVLLIRFKKAADPAVFDLLRSFFHDRNKDFVVNVNDYDVAIVKEVTAETETEDIENLARSIADTVGSQMFVKAQIGIGRIVQGVKDIARSYKEAQTCLSVCKVFDTDKNIVSYDNLGIARLIYQLPVTLCDSFLREIFKRDSIESLDQETLFTIQKFFENNLNVSETSRKLFVHRNTLVYRLEKINKITGLDLREFDDAIVFKIALMVKKYLDSKQA